MREDSGKIAATFVSCSFDITLCNGSLLRLHIQCHVGENELLMYRRHCRETVAGSVECLEHINLRSIGVISLCSGWIIKSRSRVLFLPSCGFVRLEPGVFINANKTNKAHLHVKASGEGVHAPLGQEHFEERRVLWQTLAQRPVGPWPGCDGGSLLSTPWHLTRVWSPGVPILLCWLILAITLSLSEP